MAKAKSKTKDGAAKKIEKPRAEKTTTVTEKKAAPQDEVIVVAASDGLCGPGVVELRDELKEAVSLGRKKVAIDMAKVTEIDGQGLALLVQCQNSLGKQGGQLSVVTSNSDWRDLFETTGLCGHISIKTAV